MCDIAAVAVGAVSSGKDSISCRDIRYKGEDTSAYRHIERSSDSCEPAVSDVVVSNAPAASSALSSVTETAAVGGLASNHPRPITKQLAINMQPSDSSQPADLQQPEPARPITLQQTGLPAVCQPQPASVQQLAISMREPDFSRPLAMQSSDLSQPIMSQQLQMPGDAELITKQPDASQTVATQQPITVAQMETVAIRQPSLSQPVTSGHPVLAQTNTSQQQQPQPIATKEPGLAQILTMEQPATVAQLETSHPVTTRQPNSSQPVTSEPSVLAQPNISQLQQVPVGGPPQPITTKQPLLSEAITIEQSTTVIKPGSSLPVAMQQPTFSLPFSSQQQQPANSAVSSLPANTLPTNTSDWPPVTGWYRPLTPCVAFNRPSSVPMLSHPPTSTSPVPPATASPVPYTNAPPIPQPTFIHEFISRPPPPLEFSTSPSPPRAPQPQVWSGSPSSVAGSSISYPPRPVAPSSSSPTPGILCHPLTPEVKPYVPTQEYVQATNLDPQQTETLTQSFGEGGGDGPPPFPYAYSKQFRAGLQPAEHRATSLPPEISASSSALGNGQRDLGPVESFGYGSGQTYGSNDGRGGEYGYGVYTSPYNVQYYAAPQNMWMSRQLTPEFKSPAEYPSAEPVPQWPPMTRYVYAPPGESHPVTYHVPPGIPLWDVRGTAVDYRLSMLSSPEMPASVVPASQSSPSTMLQDEVITQGSVFSGGQSPTDYNVSSSVHRQTYADKVRSVPTVQQTDYDLLHSTTDRNDSAPQTFEQDETEKFDTIAGTFSRGNFALWLSFFCMHSCSYDGCVVVITKLDTSINQVQKTGTRKNIFCRRM